MRTREVSTGSQSKVVKPRSFTRRVLAFITAATFVFSGVMIAPPSAMAVQNPNLIVNGGFEDVTYTYNAANPQNHGNGSNGVGAPTAADNTAVNVTGWQTTEFDNDIEIWQSGFTPGNPGGLTFRSAGSSGNNGAGNVGGNWFAEINANKAGAALYQDVTTTPGALYQWSFLHRARLAGTPGYDTAQMLLGDANNVFPTTAAAQSAGFSAAESLQMAGMLNPNTYAQPATATYDALNGSTFTGNLDTSAPLAHPGGADSTDPKLLTAKNGANGYVAGNWVEHLGYYTVPAGQTTTSYQLYAEDAAGGNKAMGNLVDNATFIMIALPDKQTIPANGSPSASPMVTSLEDGFTSGAPDYTGIPADPSNPGLKKPGVYDVPVDILEGGVKVGTVTSKIIVQPVVTTQYQLTDGTVIGTPTTTAMNYSSTDSPTGSYTDPSYAAGDPVTVSGVTGNYKFVQLATGSSPVTGTNVTTNAKVVYVLEEIQDVTGTVSGLPASKLGGITVHYKYTDPVTGDLVEGDVTTESDGSYTVPDVPKGAVITTSVTGQDFTGYNTPTDKTLDTSTGTVVPDLPYTPKKLDVAGTVSGLPADKLSGVEVDYSYTDPVSGLPVTGITYTKPDGTYTIPGVPEGATVTATAMTDVAGYNTPTPQTLTVATDATQVPDLPYTPIPHKVTTKFVDAKGQPIPGMDPIVDLTRATGSAYDTTPNAPATVTVNGVTYIRQAIPANATGTLGDSDVTVTYVYAPAPATVVTNFVDVNGDPIVDPTSDLSTSGAPYTTTPPERITNPATGEKWLLVGISPDTIDPASGTIQGEGADVTYVYQAANTVTVTLLGPDGKPMPNQPDVVWQPSGSDYTVKNPGTVVINGVTYKYVLQPGSDAESGTLDGDKGLVYKLVPVEVPNPPNPPKPPIPLTGDMVNLALPFLLFAIAAIMAVAALRRRHEA